MGTDYAGSTTALRPTVAIKILYLLLFTSVFSTLASLGGGMVLYGRSIKALEDVIEKVSDAETESLGSAVNAVVERALEAEGFLHTNLLLGGMDGNLGKTVETWSQKIQWLGFSHIKRHSSLNELGIELLPITEYSDSVFYEHVWFEDNKDDKRIYVKAAYNNAQYNNTAEEGSWPKPIAFPIDVSTGVASKERLYSFDFPGNEFNFTQILDRTAVRNIVLGGEDDDYYARKLRPPGPWTSADNTTYIFVQFVKLYKPPAPPHPWSGFRGLVFRSGFNFNKWNEIIDNYARNHNGTEVVLFDWDTEIVYAATSIKEVISLECLNKYQDRQDFTGKLAECSVSMNNTNGAIQTGWSSIRGSSREGFFKKGSWFIRTKQLYKFKDDLNETSISAGIMWMQTTDSVQSQVNEALIYLLLFVSAVLLFDTILALTEYFLVARPLAAIAIGTMHLRSMDTVSAREAYSQSLSHYVSVHEVKHLTNGLLFACDMLDEYKAFLPSTVFIAATTTEIDEQQIIANTVELPSGNNNNIAVITINNSANNSSLDSGKSPVNLQPTAGFGPKLNPMNTIKGVLMQLEVPGPLDMSTPHQAHFSMLIATLQEITNTTTGMLHPFGLLQSDVMLVSWNLARPCPDATFKACVAADKLRGSLGRWKSCALQGGSYTAGNIGTTTYRGFSVTGQCLEGLRIASLASAHLTAFCGTPLCVAPHSLEEVVHGRITSRALLLCAQSSDHQPCVFFEIGAPTDRVGDEWMYVLASHRDPLLGLLQDVNAGDLNGLEAGLEKLPASLTPSQMYAVSLLRRAVASGPQGATLTFRKEELI
eukprot:TRINITY_DN37355_c0_g1_i1.p1 TRINITY_DN37355_c0_g1~~TRINITY_DN37355_c0_g1_i1.p1  ORF type:complete len:819 (+),score=102.10 TRINITY_DN37355_c0_g1_i1:52-2508(+)